MKKSSEALLFFFLFLFLFSSNVMAVYTSLSGHDEGFSTADSVNLISYEHTGSSCFQKGWYSDYGPGGVVYFNSNCSAYTTHTFYLKTDMTINWPNSIYPAMATITYYINDTGNWDPNNRPSFYIYDTNTSSIVESINLTAYNGWVGSGIATQLITGHHYWVILDFKTWTNMPPVFIAIDKIQFGTLSTPIFNVLENVSEMPSSCSLQTNTSYFYPFSNTTSLSLDFTGSAYQCDYVNSYWIGPTAYKNIGQSFTVARNSTLYGVGIEIATASNGTYNLTVRQDSNTGPVLAYNSSITLINTSNTLSSYSNGCFVEIKYLDIKLNTNVSLNSGTTYYLQIYNTTPLHTNQRYGENNLLWLDYGGNSYINGEEQVKFSSLGTWCGSIDCGLGYRDTDFALQITSVSGASLPGAIQNNTNGWANINYIEGFDTNHWDRYYTNTSGNLSILSQGQIFRVVTTNGMPYTFYNCVNQYCGEYISSSTYAWPFEYTLVPEQLGNYLERVSDLSIIYAYNGITWDYYDSSNKIGSTLKVLKRGQQFYIITKTGNSYKLGIQFYGTKCDMTDYSGRSYLVYNGCSITSGQCPLNTKCSQITPQAGITTPLIENFVDCSMCWSLNSVVGNKLIWTNCPNNPECRCDGSGFCKANSFATNVSTVPFSVTEWAIGCYDPYGQKVLWIVNSTGYNTTEEAMINQSLNQTPQTPTAPNSITSLGAWINTGLATPYGSMLIAFICSIFFATTLFFKIEDKKIEGFIVPFVAILGGFSLPGVEFFPLWIWLVLTIFTGVLIFWKTKSG